jgi:hypothetical protein
MSWNNLHDLDINKQIIDIFSSTFIVPTQIQSKTFEFTLKNMDTIAIL